ncbi:MAG: hypothetical protein HOF15_07855 [Planctomycetaceae bacterium]|nr:hypothetical protein [Planctomycetaceae bacterium]
MTDRNNNQNEATPAGDRKKGFWTLDRIIIYFVLGVAVLVGANDYWVRSQWESDYEQLVAAVTFVNTPRTIDATDVDLALVETIRSGGGVKDWMIDHGYTVDDLQSSEFEQIYQTSSGVRTFFVNIDVRRDTSGDKHLEVITSVSRDELYAWNEMPGGQQVGGTDEETSGGQSRGGRPQMESMGGGGGAQQGDGRRSFDPAQIFADRDEDMDGLLSGSEISERMQSRVAEMDEDKDGAISKDEFVKAMTAMMAARRQSGGGGGGAGGGGASEPGLMNLPNDPYAEGELGFPDPNSLPEDVEKLKEAKAANR